MQSVRTSVVKQFQTLGISNPSELEQALYDKFQPFILDQLRGNYKNTFIKIFYNLKRNPELINKYGRKILIELEDEWITGDLNYLQQKREKYKCDYFEFFAIINDLNENDGAGIKCRKCGQLNTILIMRQTRSADEPMTQFIYCKNKECGHSWKQS